MRWLCNPKWLEAICLEPKWLRIWVMMMMMMMMVMMRDRLSGWLVPLVFDSLGKVLT